MCTGFGREAKRKETTRKTYTRREYNIMMDRREIVWDGMDWIDVAQDLDQWRALVKTVI
jgi:uncharacterized protein (DUF2342 family)